MDKLPIKRNRLKQFLEIENCNWTLAVSQNELNDLLATERRRVVEEIKEVLIDERADVLFELDGKLNIRGITEYGEQKLAEKGE